LGIPDIHEQAVRKDKRKKERIMAKNNRMADETTAAERTSAARVKLIVVVAPLAYTRGKTTTGISLKHTVMDRYLLVAGQNLSEEIKAAIFAKYPGTDRGEVEVKILAELTKKPTPLSAELITVEIEEPVKPAA
jgi:hypothetical protein